MSANIRAQCELDAIGMLSIIGLSMALTTPSGVTPVRGLPVAEPPGTRPATPWREPGIPGEVMPTRSSDGRAMGGRKCGVLEMGGRTRVWPAGTRSTAVLSPPSPVVLAGLRPSGRGTRASRRGGRLQPSRRRQPRAPGWPPARTSKPGRWWHNTSIPVFAHSSDLSRMSRR